MTTIEWTEETINPSTGCDKISPGCDRCYALTLAGRLKSMGQAKYQTDGDPRTSGPGFGFAMHPQAMQAALRTRKPTMWFVNSMSDLFHAKATREFLAYVYAVMASTQRHTYQILTKRPLHAQRVLSDPAFVEEVTRQTAKLLRVGQPDFRVMAIEQWPLPNVWLGVSVEDQERDMRIPYLLGTPAAVRFLSCEPLLGPLDLTRVAWTGGGGTHLDVVNGRHGEPGLWSVAAQRLSWVIVGGESGPGARPMETAWAQRIVDDCRAAGVAAFVKQLGTATGGRAHHNIDTFPPGLQVREYPQVATT